MATLSTHILDTSLGIPAEDVEVTLEKKTPSDEYVHIGGGKTNKDGRVANLIKPENTLDSGLYRLVFLTERYFERQQKDTFYPYVRIDFRIKETNRHYHVPLLINGFGFSSYRGS